MLRYPEISWVSVNTWANTVNIVIQEGEKKPEVERDDAVGNVVATRAGQIVSMDVYHGKAMVKLGDGVAPGELLVSGVLENAQGGVSFTKAAAKIMARTRRQFTATIPMEETLWEDTGEVVVRKSARIFGLTIPLTFHGIPEGDYEKTADGESVWVNGVELPVTVYAETYTAQRARTVAVSEEEARQRGIEEIQKQQEEALAHPTGNGSVLSENVTVTAENGEYKIESDCLCLENIVQEQEFFVELEEEMPSSDTESDTES